jgi:predicted DNA-binding transcriptional regulator YafY
VAWPVALVYFEEARVLAAWCELRADFRHFRVNRVAHLEVLDELAPRSAQALMKDWREALRATGRTILPEPDSGPL